MPRRKRKPVSKADSGRHGTQSPQVPGSATVLGTNLGQVLKKAAQERQSGPPAEKKPDKNQTPKPAAPTRPGSPRSLPVTQPPPGPAPAAPVSEPPGPGDSSGRQTDPRPTATELRWLNDAYQGVTPLRRAARASTRRAAARTGGTQASTAQTRAGQPGHASGNPGDPRGSDEQVRARLDALVGEDVRFVVDEREDGFVAARRQGVATRELRRLRGPMFTPEASLDLHGAGRAEVARTVASFVRKQQRRGRRFVLIVHGKGLHSEGGHGVLGEAVFEALTRGGAAPLVRALCTPHERHGGRGATAVALGPVPTK